MRIGVPKEIKTHEYRVGLVPGSARELIHRGHEVMVETGAGAFATTGGSFDQSSACSGTVGLDCQRTPKTMSAKNAA